MTDRISGIEDHDFHAQIARTLFALDWADWADEQDIDLIPPGAEIFDLVPFGAMPIEYRFAAHNFVGQIEALNACNVWAIIACTMRHEGYDSSDDAPDDLITDLAHYLTMEAVGHGVCWEDSHNPAMAPDFILGDRPLKLPCIETPMIWDGGSDNDH